MLYWILVIFCVVCGARVPDDRDAEDCGLHGVVCGDGRCVFTARVCDGQVDCTDGADERDCPRGSAAAPDEEHAVVRAKRQTTCRKNQWRCRDGTCIGFDGKCDGVRDCPDGSDETHALCRNMTCQSNWFRCTYGACVDGTAACNGVTECADASDEMQPRCFTEVLEVRGKFKCRDGSEVDATSRCDGARDCADGSDETVRACAAMRCPAYAFQCAYGACVDQGSDCDGKKDCADGSDEDAELCNRLGEATLTPTPTSAPGSTATGEPSRLCRLPPPPEHGSYTVSNMTNTRPGELYDSFYLEFSCDVGYSVEGPASATCYNGFWFNEIPKCIRSCRLNPHPSVEYSCPVPGTFGRTRPCELYEPSGTQVQPNCRAPNYYAPQFLPPMRCMEGSWDYVATCIPECGRVTPAGSILIIDGRVAERGELPWHAGIYRRNGTALDQICGGSIISTGIVVSAAHCFWSDVEKLLPASRFSVAVGKLYREWNDPKDRDAQTSNVGEIKVPARFRGSQTNFQDDIALLMLSTPLVYETFVRPICIDFDVHFNTRQLQPGHLGKVAGWGYMSESGQSSPVLKVVDLPYVDINECLQQAPPGFREYITSDKICAGYNNGTALCKGDSGGGLAFPESERGVTRYYLRGLVSTAPNNANECNAYAMTSFTQITSHEYFIKENYGGAYT